jgi:ribosome-associated protein
MHSGSRRCSLSVWEVRTTIETSARHELARQLALRCANVAAEHKGRDVVVLDLRKLTPIVDYFVIASGTSRRQIHTMAEEIDRSMNQHGETKIGIEGYEDSRWVLLDYGDIVIHLFDADTRRYYDLENLWGDAPKVESLTG